MPEQRTKNNGSDPKKADDTDVDVGATDRVCRMMVVNRTGKTITNVALMHSSGDVNTVINVASLADGDSSPEKQISYETGPAADFDYWNVSFTVKNTPKDEIYDTKNNDRCNISYEDAGGLIRCELTTTPKYGGDYDLFVDMPKSSDCHFGIWKKS